MSRWTPIVGTAAVCAAVISAPFRPIAAQQASTCASCQEGAALVKRFGLRESATAVREKAGWSPPKRIVTFGGEEWAAALRAVAPNAEIIGAANSDEALKALPGADVFVGLCTPEVLRAGTSLKWMQLISAGADSCAALPEVAQRGILLTNAQAIYGPQIAEHVMAMILSFARRLPSYNTEQHSRQWSHKPADPAAVLASGIWELNGKTLLVVGLGGIGTEVATRAHALGMRVIATRNSRSEKPEFVEYVGLADEADDLAARADVVVNATPLTPATRGMFDARFFQRMKATAYFINVGRGESVVTADLVEALQSRKIAGAGLDVTDPEPLPREHPLWSMPNVILTPHIAAGSDQMLHRITVLAVENLRRYVNGDRMLSVVDLQRGY